MDSMPDSVIAPAVPEAAYGKDLENTLALDSMVTPPVLLNHQDQYQHTPTLSSAVSSTSPLVMVQATIAATTAASSLLHSAAAESYYQQPEVSTTFPVLRQLLAFSFSILAFVTITIPSAVYRLLSWSFTLHLTFTTLLAALVLICIAVYYVVRYRLLTKYSRLPQTGAGKHGPSFDLHPDNPIKSPQEEKEGVLSYPDEFLSAFLSSIKIFGYLEQPVFHELARHLQTRRLLAGDTLLQQPELEKSFYIVVDGCVQVYEKVIDDDDESDDDNDHIPHDGPSISQARSWDENEEEGYQLLNEVKNGGTLSSLFTILSLFTENVKLRHDDDPIKEFKRSESSRSRERDRLEHILGPRETFDPQHQHHHSHGQRRTNLSARSSMNHRRGSKSSGGRNASSPLSNPNHMAIYDNTLSPEDLHTQESEESSRHEPLDDSHQESEMEELSPSADARPPQPRRSSSSTTERTRSSIDGVDSQRHKQPRLSDDRKRGKRHVIVAKAMVDTTLAVIPAEAFHRLTQKFPQAAAHIVQVILIRFQRVTLLTGHKYLGLTKELLRMERSINEIGSYGLPPDFFRPRTMEYLKKKFSSVRCDDSDDDDHPLAIKIRQDRRRIGRADLSSTNKALDSVSGVSPLPALPTSMHQEEHVRQGSGYTALVDDGNEEEDSYLRDQVMECLSRSIGLVQSPAIRPVTSTRTDLRTTGSSDYFSAVFQATLKDPTLQNLGGYPMRKSGSHASTSDMTLGEDLNPNSSSASSTVPSVMSEMENDVELMFFPAGAVLVEEGQRNAGLFFVIDGVLDVSITPKQDIKPKARFEEGPNAFGHHISSLNLKGSVKSPQLSSTSSNTSTRSSNNHRHKSSDSSKPFPLFSIGAGGLAGYLSALSGYPSFVTITAHTDTYVGHLSKQALDRVMERNPTVLLTLAKRLISLIPPIVLHLDYAMEWMQVNASQVLHREGDDSDSIYIVLNGRLRTILEKEPGKIEILREYSQGESVGELEVLMATPFPSTLHAIRDTEVARMPRTLFNTLALRHPEITIRISRLIAQRASEALGDGRSKSHGVTPDSAINNSNLRTVGILPISSNVPVMEFAERLRGALIGIGSSATLLNHSTVMSQLGKHAFTKIGKLKLDSWLNEQEEMSQIVLYLADGGLTSPWTQTCIRQADCILLVGHGDDDPAVGDFERLLISMKTTARKELVLLHPTRHCSPGSTAAWLKSRVWVHAHHHVQMPFKGPHLLGNQGRKKTIMNLRDHLEKFYTNMRPNSGHKAPAVALNPNRNDFARLARRLTGRTVGLVLGGGGARGIAHIGVIRALEEAGIPIDIVGGTSMGAFIGGLYAREADQVSAFGRAKMFCGRMAAKWRMVWDLTYPVTSWTTGHEFNRGIWKCFSDTQIQDFWLSYYCNTTNITFSRMEIHQMGYAWRYIRASMSLSGFLPPLCDAGHMLVDGGYMDNLPVEYMLSLGADTIFAVDVGSDDDTTLREYGDSLSGWLVLLNRWNPFSTVYRTMPNLADLQSRLAYVSSVKQLEAAKATPGLFYLKPPVQGFGTLEFGRFKDIIEVGYEYGKEMLAKWEKEGRLDKLLAATEKVQRRTVKRVRRNSI
ncbi:phosphatidylcholine and lysophosphatidylcholine phospholipase [Actinomortierella wolfii]|nr:phosphatidylcholine and lysophosphatidylcholine phospholipase [Actinomortierella wolfii]